MLGVNFIAGSGMYAEWYYMLVLFGLLPIGVILRKCDMMPCLFAFVLSYPIESSFRRIITIHSGVV
jgi:TctA family transporter